MAAVTMRSLAAARLLATKTQPQALARSASRSLALGGAKRSNYTFAPLTQLSEEEVMFKDTGACIAMVCMRPQAWLQH